MTEPAGAADVSEDRYWEFDAKRKAVEGVAADESDFAEIEQLSRREDEEL